MSSRPFSERHIGPDDADVAKMLGVVGAASLEEFLGRAVPSAIRLDGGLNLPEARSEERALADLAELASQNRPVVSLLGMGYSPSHTPSVIRRNILENPGWYTAYTPYQAEISQGRLEALLNFQTMVCDLTGMDISNASLLDEGTAAAEAMAMAQGIRGGDAIYVAEDSHPQTLAVLRTRATPLGIRVLVGPSDQLPAEPVFAVFLQNPSTHGELRDLDAPIAAIHAAGALAIVAVDLLSLALVRPPGESGADIVVGSAQRFGLPLGFGGPHAAFLATRDEHKRRLPGRLVGVSKDASGKSALRLTLQTREQHIRRDKATSNICTAQVLPAVMAAFFAVYHGPDGLRKIAHRIHDLTRNLAARLRRAGYVVGQEPYFDTLRIELNEPSDALLARAEAQGFNLRKISDRMVGVSLDETTEDIAPIAKIFGALESVDDCDPPLPKALERSTEILRHPVFRAHHTETGIQRYMRRLEARDLSLVHSMIPLGSCTMKLNAASEMLPLTWPTISTPHPFAPEDQTRGSREIADQLAEWLGEITGLPAVSLQPNAGSQGEYAGLLAIRSWHLANGDDHRTVCLIPTSAHGTNPASAVMAGFRVIPVACDKDGNIDRADLTAKIATHADALGALMVTYPSTHGVFEEGLREICSATHAAGGLVYLDGANMNALVGLCRLGEIGADVCHLNLHKTFCIPHGGGGPGVGPICATPALAPYLPGHPLRTPRPGAPGPVAAAPLGSASVLVIAWMYLAMMGPAALTRATAVSILSANYIAARLRDAFPILYRGRQGLVAHECILDFREWKARAGIEVEDVAKRLMDFGFHAPTMSWPVPGTLMVEPTESEPLDELDRFCEAMLAIRSELQAIADGTMDRQNNPLKNAPHTAAVVCADSWDRPYSREQAAFPAPWQREGKFWPAVGRVDNVFGDRNIFCSCPPMEELV